MTARNMAGKVLQYAFVVALAGVAACHGRPVEVRTAPAQPTAVTVQVNNNLSQAVNFYVRRDSVDTFMRQVAANSSVTVPVQGFQAGSTVTLKAVTVDGTRTFSRANVVLNGTYVFPLP